MNEIGSYRSGVVAIIGRANAGKSTLINRLLGEKIAIVTSKPQTTRSRILGVLTREAVQFLFVDTPGFHEGQKALNRALVQLAEEAIKDCDVALLLVDSTKGFSASYRDIVFKLQENTKPVVAVATKIDLVPKTEMHWPEELSFSARCSVSAKTNFGIDALLQLLEGFLPEGPRYYSPDQLSDRPLRFFVSELIREVAFEMLGDEVPYDLAVDIRDFDESQEDLISINADLLVETASQKKIVIGKGGRLIKELGIRSRHKIERFLGSKIYLGLFVKHEARWSKKPGRIKALGYN